MYAKLGKQSEALCAFEEALSHIDKYDMITSGKEHIKSDIQVQLKILKIKE